MNDPVLIKAYEEVNKYWPCINYEMIENIMDKMSDIHELFIEHFAQKFNERIVEQERKNFLIYKIRSNETCTHPSTLNTIISIILCMFHFQFEFTNYPYLKLYNAYDWIFTHVHEIKKMINKKDYRGKPLYKSFCFNNDNIPEVYEWFINLDINEINEWIQSSPIEQ